MSNQSQPDRGFSTDAAATPTAAGDDLLWVAVQYRLGELSTSESAAFETRLLEDQSAREALSQAVELTMACRLAEAEIELESLQPTATALHPLVPAPANEAVWMRPVGWASLAAAACLAVLIGWQNWVTQPLLAQQEAKTLAVATAWAEVAALDQTSDAFANDAL
ncbi:MAG: hypothetical protein JNM18_14985, partial [Planctomycetaceae bacterium]|nr:hypothetical protein [Planctomycetaceae bacterium]